MGRVPKSARLRAPTTHADRAIAGLVKGYSGVADSGAIIHLFHSLKVARRWQPWFSFVYSEDNISDLPSRGDYALLRSMGAVWRDCVLPSLAQLLEW